MRRLEKELSFPKKDDTFKQYQQRLLAAQKARGVQIYNDVELLHLYKQLKDPNLRNELDGRQLEHMSKKCWETLRVVMNELLLTREFEVIESNYKRKTKPSTSSIRKRGKPRFDALEEKEA